MIVESFPAIPIEMYFHQGSRKFIKQKYISRMDFELIDSIHRHGLYDATIFWTYSDRDSKLNFWEDSGNILDQISDLMIELNENNIEQIIETIDFTIHILDEINNYMNYDAIVKAIEIMDENAKIIFSKGKSSFSYHEVLLNSQTKKSSITGVDWHGFQQTRTDINKRRISRREYINSKLGTNFRIPKKYIPSVPTNYSNLARNNEGMDYILLPPEEIYRNSDRVDKEVKRIRTDNKKRLYSSIEDIKVFQTDKDLEPHIIIDTNEPETFIRAEDTFWLRVAGYFIGADAFIGYQPGSAIATPIKYK